jgi:hypothetical protein
MVALAASDACTLVCTTPQAWVALRAISAIDAVISSVAAAIVETIADTSSALALTTPAWVLVCWAPEVNSPLTVRSASAAADTSSA